MSWKGLSAVTAVAFVLLFPVTSSFGLTTFILDAQLQKRQLISNCPTPDGYYNGSRDGETYNIGSFISDGIGNFQKCADNPLLSVSSGSWDARHVKDPYVIKKGGIYYLYYTGSDGLHGYNIGLATSTDGLHFKKYSNNPIIRTGEQATNSYGSSFPVVYINTQNVWHMLFTSTYESGSGGISHASSVNGYDWQLDEANQVLKLPWVSLLIAGDIDNNTFYFGSRESGKDSLRSASLPDLKVSNLKWYKPPCSYTPRAVKESTMIMTVYGCEAGIRETSALAVKEEGVWQIIKLGVLGTPEPGSLKWDAISAENATWVRYYD